MGFRSWFQGMLAPKFSALPRITGPAFVLGSAPNPVPFRGRPEQWTLATVNGSQAVAAVWGLQPKLTLFGLTFVYTTPSNREARKVISGKGTDQLICVGARKRYFYYLRLVRKLGYRYRRLTMLTPHERDILTAAMIGEREKVTGKASNGVFLALLCLHLGASKVVMGGFSLSKHGHEYNDKGYFRKHIDADTLVLALALKAGLLIYTNDPAFAAESGLPLFEEVEGT